MKKCQRNLEEKGKGSVIIIADKTPEGFAQSSKKNDIAT
jgi:hypothetical protein